MTHHFKYKYSKVPLNDWSDNTTIRKLRPLFLVPNVPLYRWMVVGPVNATVPLFNIMTTFPGPNDIFIAVLGSTNENILFWSRNKSIVLYAYKSGYVRPSVPQIFSLVTGVHSRWLNSTHWKSKITWKKPHWRYSVDNNSCSCM